MNKDYNFTVKLTLDCPGNCRCCTNRQKNFMEKGKNKLVYSICIILRKFAEI